MKEKQEFVGVKNSAEKTEDLNVKIVSEDEELWMKVRDEASMLIKNHERSLIVQKAMLALSIKKISELQRKSKK